MSCITEASRQTPIAGTADVIVCGGGPAGVTAAICAARLGARVRLIEVNGCLGGVWTAGQLTWMFEMNQPGFARELSDLLDQRGGAFRQPVDKAAAPKVNGCYSYDAEAMKVLLEELCVGLGIDILLKTRVVSTVVEDGRIAGVVTENCGGRQAWRAATVIDASGNGDVAALAGCAWEMGRPEDGATQPLTLMALMTVDDPEALRPWVSFWRGSLDWSERHTVVGRCLASLAEAGITPSYGKPTIFHTSEKLFSLMINHEYGVSAIDGQQMTNATLRARAELFRAVEALRGLGGPFTGLRLIASAEQIGIREGRRIQGRYRLTRDDLLAGRRFPDAVARASFNIDVHHPRREEGSDMKLQSVQPYDIPLRCCLARDIDGLLLAGRCISGDFHAHASYRVTGVAARLGQAVGTCAALACRTGILPHQVPIDDLQALLPPLT